MENSSHSRKQSKLSKSGDTLEGDKHGHTDGDSEGFPTRTEPIETEGSTIPTTGVQSEGSTIIPHDRESAVLTIGASVEMRLVSPRGVAHITGLLPSNEELREAQEELDMLIFGNSYRQVIVPKDEGPVAKFQTEGLPKPMIVDRDGKRELKSCCMCVHSRWRYDSFSCIIKKPISAFSEKALQYIANECPHYSWTGIPYHTAFLEAMKIVSTPPKGEEKLTLVWRSRDHGV